MEMVTVMGLTILLSGSWELMRSSPDYFFRATSGVTHHGLHSAFPRRLPALQSALTAMSSMLHCIVVAAA